MPPVDDRFVMDFASRKISAAWWAWRLDASACAPVL
jgi:hypothetical protein